MWSRRSGDGVDDFQVGDEVIGFTDNRASQAELVVIDAENATPKPAGVPWEVAGALYVVGATAYAAVRAVNLSDGDTVVVSGAAGGVGSLAVQLARRAGATVIGLASEPNHEWLRGHGVIPVTYGDGVAERIREAAPDGVDAFLDTDRRRLRGARAGAGRGPGPHRHDRRLLGAGQIRRQGRGQRRRARAPQTLAELAALIDEGALEVPIAATYPLDQVRDAYAELERNHTRGKIVLVP